MGKLKRLVGIGLLSLLGCGENPVTSLDGKQHKAGDVDVTTSVHMRELSRRIDVNDVIYTEDLLHQAIAVDSGEGIELNFIGPDTLSFNETNYLLGFVVKGKERVEHTRTTRWIDGGGYVYPSTSDRTVSLADFGDLRNQLNQAIGSDEDYLPFGEGHLGHIGNFKMDLPNVSESFDLLERLAEVNNSPLNWDIGYNLVYLRNVDRSLVTNESGESIVDGMEIYPKVEENAGRSGMGYDAIWAISGDERFRDYSPRISFTDSSKTHILDYIDN